MTSNPFLQPPSTSSIQPGDIVNGRYQLPHPVTGLPHSWTRTTNFIEKIADKYAIHEWDKREIIRGLVMREDLYVEACATDLEDKKALNNLAERAKEVSGGNTGARLGTALHTFTERGKRSEVTRAPRKWQGKVDLYLSTLHDYHLYPRTDLLERRVVSLKYNLAGTFDDGLDSAEYGLVIGDTKTQKEFYSYCDPAMQLAVYANADVMWNKETLAYEEMPPFNRDLALVLWLPARGIGETQDVCDVRWVDIATGWEKVGLANQVYEWQKAGKRKNEIGGIYVPNPLKITEAYARRLRDAGTFEDLHTLWDEVNERGFWKVELRDLFDKRRSQLLLGDLVSTVDKVSTVN